MSSRMAAPKVLAVYLLSLVLCSVVAVPPPGFQKQRVTGDLRRVTAVQFLPDERMLVAEKQGSILIGSLETVPVELSTYLNLKVRFHESVEV